jgi:general secretion pathway protein G
MDVVKAVKAMNAGKPASIQRAFTLVELLVVMAIIATLLSIAVPRYFQHLDLARENSLKLTLSVLRDTIDKYHADTGGYPATFDELIQKRYLRRLPVDPISENSDTWVLVPPPQTIGSQLIWDVHSGAEGNAHDGTAYRDW